MKLSRSALVVLVAVAAAFLGPAPAGAAPTVNASTYEPMIFGARPGGGIGWVPGLTTMTAYEQFVQIVADVSGAASFAYDYSADGGSTWTTFCSGTLPPELVGVSLSGLSCGTGLAGVPDGIVIFRVSATDTAGATATSRSAAGVTVARSVPVTRVSVGAAGGDVHGASCCPDVSADGRFVAFSSTAPDLVPGPAGGSRDLYVRDLASGTTERVGSGGTGVTISDDGNVVAWDSFSGSVAVRDRATATTVTIGRAWASAVSGDGRYVSFLSDDALVPADTNALPDAYVLDRTTGARELVSIAPGGAAAGAATANTSLSRDGRYVAFSSAAANLVPGDRNAVADVFVRDRLNGTTERVSVDSDGHEDAARSAGARINADGSVVAFASDAALAPFPGESNHIYARDRSLGVTELVAQFGTGPAISDDGRVVGYEDGFHVRTYDRTTTITRLVVDRNADGVPGDSNGYGPALGADGSVVAFYSGATNLVEDDGNGETDVFVVGVRLPQSIAFAPLADHVLGDTPFEVAASGGGSSNPVTFTAAGACTIRGSTVTLTGLGTCTLTAHQEGDTRFVGAPDVARSFAVVAPRGCNVAGRVHGDAHFTSVAGAKRVDVHVEVDAVCGFDRKAGSAVLRLGKVRVTIAGSPPLIDAKHPSGRDPGEVSGVSFAAPGEALVGGSWKGVPFIVALADGGRDTRLDTVRAQCAGFDTATLSSPRADVLVEAE